MEVLSDQDKAAVGLKTWPDGFKREKEERIGGNQHRKLIMGAL